MSLPDPEALNLAEIDADLAGTIFHGRMHHFCTIDSTNNCALEQARRHPQDGGAPHGSFYVADEQTAGRGRSDHNWHSEAREGLYLSVLLRPRISVADLTWLPLLAGLAAHRAIHEVTALNTDLRWPNDLLISDRKAGGILVEALTEARATAVVIGIGINLHQRQFPSGLSTEATSLDLETGRFVSRQQLLVALLQSLQTELHVLDSPAALATIPARIAVISTWVQGRRVEVHGPRTCTGVTDGLDARGFLRVRTTTGLITITTGGIREARD